MWNSVIGHAASIRQLRSDIRGGTVHHAYLFSGPAHIGKSLVARIFAAELQSQTEKEIAPLLHRISSGIHPDVVLIADDGEPIKIETVRELREKMYTSFQSSYHICIIEEIARMTRGAANAFLKLMEEPPAGTVFVLTTARINGVLPTLISRARLVRFGGISHDELDSFLRECVADLSSGQRERLLTYADQRPGRIVEYMRDSVAFDTYAAMHDELGALLQSHDIVSMFQYAEKLAAISRDDLELFFLALMKMLRERAGQGDSRIPMLFQRVEYIRRMIRSTNVNKRLALENLMLYLR